MRVVIAGAGSVGRSIARELLTNGHAVLLVDKDPSAIRVNSVPDAEWLLADACEIASLAEAGLADCDVVVAASGDDKVNLVVSLLAKTEYGVPRTVARVNTPSNEWLFDEAWGVDVAVSTPRLMTRAGRGGRVDRRPGPDLHVPAGAGDAGRADAARRLTARRHPGRGHHAGRTTPCWSASSAASGRSRPAGTTRSRLTTS